MRDDMGDLEWLRTLLVKAQSHAEAVSDDFDSQDGLRLTGTVMRLDRVRDTLEDAWRTLQLVYDGALERERTLNADRAIGGSPAGGEGVVADVLRAAAAGIRPARSDNDSGTSGAADVVRR
jgi:hypothetical protein